MAEAFDWAIVVATNDELASAVHEMIDAAMAKERPSFAERIVLAPLMAWIRGRVAEAAHNESRIVLFAAHAAAQSDWTAAERKRRVEAYRGLLASELEKDAPPRDAGSDATPLPTPGS